jgi:hypothetical protein
MASSQSLPERLSSHAPLHSSTIGLLNLPTEIRMMILTMLLACSGIVKLEACNGPHQRWLAKGRWSETMEGAHITCPGSQLSAQVLRVSRQIFEEGLPILYTCNKFDFTQPSIFTLPYLTYSSPAAVLRRTIGGANIKLIRHVIVPGVVKLPALISALKGLQSIEVRKDIRCGNYLRFEELGAPELQTLVAHKLPDTKGLAKALRQRRDLAVKVSINCYQLHRNLLTLGKMVSK